MEGRTKKPYVVRVFDWNKGEDIYYGDEVISPKNRGICIGFTDAEDGQYKVLVDNGAIEDWKNPLKGDRWFEIHSLSDMTQALRELNGYGLNERSAN